VNATDYHVLECLRDGARTLRDIEHAFEDDGCDPLSEPMALLILARLREENLVRFIGEGQYRRYVPTPTDDDRALRRAENRFQ
jgi:hypothetical protein